MQARVDFGILNKIENSKLPKTLSDQLNTKSADVDDDTFMMYLLNFTPWMFLTSLLTGANGPGKQSTHVKLCTNYQRMNGMDIR